MLLLAVRGCDVKERLLKDDWDTSAPGPAHPGAVKERSLKYEEPDRFSILAIR